MKQDSSQHGLRITENMVEQIAVVAYEDVRKRHQGNGLPSWAGSDALTRYKMKEETLRILKLTIPVLLEEGWAPPACEFCQHQHSADVCGYDIGGDSICWCTTEDGEQS